MILQNKTLTRSMSELHTWGGLLFGWLLFVIFFTGTLTIFEPELTHWMQPSVRISPTEAAQAVAVAEKKLRQLAPQADSWMIVLPQDRHQNLKIIWKKDKVTLERYIDPQTGGIIKAPASEGGEFFADFHYQLHSGKTGLWIVSFASVAMLAALISGILIRKQVFREFFQLRWRRTWLSAHTVSGVLTLPFVLLITYTGLTITFFLALQTVPQLLYGSSWKGPALVASQNFDRPRANVPGEITSLSRLVPQAEGDLGRDKIFLIRVTNPGDRNAVVTFFRSINDTVVAMSSKTAFDGITGEKLGSQSSWNTFVHIYRTLVGLHIGRFGGYPISWLYFAAGLISSAMIAAGLVFFTVKRRSRYGQAGAFTKAFYRAIEAINTAVVSGLIVACAAYLWGNRLLPAGLSSRPEAEISVFFTVWLLMLVHAFQRPLLQAWKEQLAIAAVLCLNLPVLNAVTSKVGLPAAFRNSDWMTAGVDVTAALLGIFLAAAAWQVTLKQKKQVQQNSIEPPRRMYGTDYKNH